MSGFHPYFTNDGSVGLYNEEFQDIYHSTTGALTEAYEKFIYPVDFNTLLTKNKINVLDICYGVGYNTKSFLNFIFEKICKNNKFRKDIYPIHTNNIFESKNQKYYDKIYTDNIFNKISITCIDTDKNLFYLSPFIKTGVKNFHNDCTNTNFGKIDKYINFNKPKILPKINNIINYLMLLKIIQNCDVTLDEDVFNNILYNNKYNSFFDTSLKGIFRILGNKPDNLCISNNFNYNLHNIYYKYLSEHYKRTLKQYKLQDININIKIDDARKVILNDNTTYDLIFLDAFSPSKCPCLWSFEFFTQLYAHLNEDGILLTYSSAAPIRNAMLKTGFYIGNIYNERLNKYFGTIAAKNNKPIKYHLSEFDLGLLKTKAGIIYHDENLNLENEAILKNRNIDINKSDLMSSSSYKKHLSK